MARIVALVLILIAAAATPFTATACRRMSPPPDALEQYMSVFVGRVTGLHLNGYENGLLGKQDVVDPELGSLTITNGASPVTVRVAVTHIIKGAASGALELRLAGCTFDPPQLQEKAIFFVLPGGGFTVLVRETDGAAYEAWLARLEVPQNAR